MAVSSFAQHPKNTPAQAAITFYTALNDAPQAVIDKLKCASCLANEAKLPPIIRKMRTDYTAVTQNHTLQKVEIVRENIQGERAWVDVRLHYKSGPPQNFNIGFINEGGEWKVTED